MENKFYKLTDNEFIDLVKSSLNIAEVLFKLGYSVKGNSWGYSQVKQRMADLNLNGFNFRGKSAFKKQHLEKQIPSEELLVKNSQHGRNILRRHIIKNNLLPYKCAICECTDEWQGKPLSLQLDHINGINNDNRIENLRFLCPNCHSQTDTYGSKNSKITETKYELTEDLTNKIISEYIILKNKKKVADKLRLNQKAVIQCLKDNGLYKSNQKYVIQYNQDHKELRRFGTITECCKWLMDNNLVRTKLMKTCKNTLKRNISTLWKNYYFEILDA